MRRVYVCRNTMGNKPATTAAAPQTYDADRACVNELFMALDSEKSGNLDKNELRAWLLR